MCPKCHQGIKGQPAWDTLQVLQFLKRHYGADNIVHPYTEDLEEKGLKGDGGRDFPEEGRQRSQDKIPDPEKRLDSRSRALDRLVAKDAPGRDRGKKGLESRADQEMKQAVSFLGIGFSNLDMSLCIVLYVASSFFLIIMYFFFRVRSKRWKVRYPRPAV